MSFLFKNDKFRVLERHKEHNIKFISALKVNKNAKLTIQTVSLSDFEQGDIENCGLIAALAAISQRPEFFTEIAPKIEHTSEGVKLQFSMFYKGKPTNVTIDDKLPFIKPSLFESLLGKSPSLIYARSSNDDYLYLASLFEKAVVELVCNSNYSNIECILSHYVFSLFSDCMVSLCNLKATDSKQNVIDNLKYEIDNKSSVVISIMPDLMYKPDIICKAGHAYVEMDYNLDYKAIKLYDQRIHTNHLKTNLPLSITETADPNKGERWITLDQLEKRSLSINSLCSKNMYKSVFEIRKNLKQVTYFRDYSNVKCACKVNIKQASTFMINVFLFSHEAREIRLSVYTADKQNVEINAEIPRPHLNNYNRANGEAKNFYFQRFELQPNQYVFLLETELKKTSTRNVDLMLKIGSVSECYFEEFVECKNCSRCEAELLYFTCDCKQIFPHLYNYS